MARARRKAKAPSRKARTAPTRTTRDHLAVIGGFFAIPASAPHGTNHAAYAISAAIGRAKRYGQLTVFSDRAADIATAGGHGQFRLKVPPGVKFGLADKRDLPASWGRYSAIYAVGTESHEHIPHVLRPIDDWSPVVCELDCTHDADQWKNIFVAAVTGAIRPTDGFIFKSRAAENVFLDAWNSWARQGRAPHHPPHTMASHNGVDLSANSATPKLRSDTRAWLGIAEDAPVFLAFSRLEPFNKGDQRALVVQWREVVRRVPNATLVLSGMAADGTREHFDGLLATSRSLGIAQNIILVPNPFQAFKNARNGLMSAADVFVHMTTGVEESCPLVVLEAMAHGLPVLTTAWAGLREVVRDGGNGLLIDTISAGVPNSVSRTFWGALELPLNRDLSRLASWNSSAFVEGIVALATNHPLRKKLGNGALTSVRTRHNWDKLARHRLDFVDRLAHEAEDSATNNHVDPFFAPVDFSEVLARLSGHRLTSTSRFRVKNAENATFLPQPIVAAKREAIDAVMRACLRQPRSVVELARATGAPGLEDGDDDALLASESSREFQRLLMELLTYGALEPV